LITTELGKNSLFAGSYHYYRASYIDNKVDSICTITPFVSAAFREVEEILSNAFYSGKGRSKIDSFAIPSSFLESIKRSYSLSPYLPAITNPPSFKIE
jgi:hypothetical protein